jgi:hypothetical protein
MTRISSGISSVSVVELENRERKFGVIAALKLAAISSFPTRTRYAY